MIEVIRRKSMTLNSSVSKSLKKPFNNNSNNISVRKQNKEHQKHGGDVGEASLNKVSEEEMGHLLLKISSLKSHWWTLELLTSAFCTSKGQFDHLVVFGKYIG